MLNNSGESGHPFRVPDLKEKALIFSLLKMIFVVGFSYLAFMILRVLIKKGCYTLSNAFSASIERIIWFLTIFLLI